MPSPRVQAAQATAKRSQESATRPRWRRAASAQRTVAAAAAATVARSSTQRTASSPPAPAPSQSPKAAVSAAPSPRRFAKRARAGAAATTEEGRRPGRSPGSPPRRACRHRSGGRRITRSGGGPVNRAPAPADAPGVPSSLPVYTGRFGPEEAERLLWRAGFGPRSGEALRLAELGLHRAVDALVHPPREERLVGRPPVVDGRPLAPRDAYGHDHLWWLDRMVRTTRPLVERMALVWHDWFATSNETVGSQKLMLQQNELFRQIGLGSFKGLAMRVTVNPAMLLYLNGLNSAKGAPNENYARELMELFTLGAGSGYTERDVREQARALTGWTARYRNGAGWVDFHFRRESHDDAMKVVFGKVGAFDWKTAVRL